MLEVQKMVYEYSCGGCPKYGGLGDCLAVNGCIKDKPEPEEPREDNIEEGDI
jgi:hypothetical protein